VKYAQGFTLEREKKGVLLFAFDEPEGAIEILKRKGINLVQNAKPRSRSAKAYE
jgi:hypothetical protein